jgi:hypothetical protein
MNIHCIHCIQNTHYLKEIAAMSLTTNIPKSAIVLPSNVRVSQVGTQLVLQKVKRSRKRFKMSKTQRQKISAASKKFKVPILTGISVAPAVLLSASQAMAETGLNRQAMRFVQQLLSYYTGMLFRFEGGAPIFEPARLAIGWGPIVAVGAVKTLAKGRVMAINRALSRAQIPANLG